MNNKGVVSFMRGFFSARFSCDLAIFLHTTLCLSFPSIVSTCQTTFIVGFFRLGYNGPNQW